jgi:hypothetical protein
MLESITEFLGCPSHAKVAAQFIWKFDLRNLAFRNLPGWSLLRSTSQECHQRLDIRDGIARISSLSGQALSERS